MHDENAPLHQCDLCGFKTKHKHNLKMHIKKVHEGKPAREVRSVELYIPLCDNPETLLSSPSPVPNPSSKFRIQSPEERGWDWG